MIVDLRSDTVTKPTPEMLDAMFSAKVGDDVYEEDESVNALERKAADMFGMDDALFCPSGTMTNQIAIKCHTAPMDEVICDESAHIYRYETGGIAFNSGASVKLLYGDRGRLTADMIEKVINPDDVCMPHSKLIVLENTCNRGGGSYYDLDEIESIYHLARLKNCNLHLDGARLFNALVETGDSMEQYGHFFDTISICLSKGLGAPVGSVLLGDIKTIRQARRFRKVFGGGMRQAGFLAAAGSYALDHHIERLKTDHLHARILGETLEALPYVDKLLPVDTNIVIIKLQDEINADVYVERMRDNGILCSRFGDQLVRFVTHLDVNPEMIEHTISVCKKLH